MRLRAMGHGDEIVIVDANYPAESAGPQVVRLDGVEATRALDAVLSVMPLDDFVPEACWRMQVVGAPDARTADLRRIPQGHRQARGRRSSSWLARAVRILCARHSCFAVVATGERRLYGNIILKKGIVRPE